jgi:hypothetical protein
LVFCDLTIEVTSREGSSRRGIDGGAQSVAATSQ